MQDEINLLNKAYENLWKDFCFYDVYKDNFTYENYLKYLCLKYQVEYNVMISIEKAVRGIAENNMKAFLKTPERVILIDMQEEKKYEDITGHNFDTTEEIFETMRKYGLMGTCR